MAPPIANWFHSVGRYVGIVGRYVGIVGRFVGKCR